MMRKIAKILPFLALILSMSMISVASDVPPDLKVISSAPVVISGRCESTELVTELVKGPSGEVSKKLQKVVIFVDDVLKKETEEPTFATLEKDKNFTFYTFTSAFKIIPGEKYVLFLKYYPFSGSFGKIVGYKSGGDVSAFKEKEKGGKTLLLNSYNNKGLSYGLKDKLTPEKLKEAGVKELDKDEKDFINLIQGPIKKDTLKNMIKVIDKVDKVKESKEIETIKDTKTDKEKSVPDQNIKGIVDTPIKAQDIDHGKGEDIQIEKRSTQDAVRGTREEKDQ